MTTEEREDWLTLIAEERKAEALRDRVAALEQTGDKVPRELLLAAMRAAREATVRRNRLTS